MCFLQIDVFQEAPSNCNSRSELIEGAGGQRILARRCSIHSAIMSTDFDAYYLEDPRTPQQNGRLATLSSTLPGSAKMTDAELVSFESSLMKVYGSRSSTGDRDALGIFALFCRSDRTRCEEGGVVVTPKISISQYHSFREIKWFNWDVLNQASEVVRRSEGG
jgi:hypothetical protein